MTDREIYVEFVVQGNFVKATAIDPVTGTEASIMGPAGALVRASVPRIANLSQIQPNAFTGLSISNGSHRLLEMIQRKLSTHEIMQGLRAGGLKPSNYHNTYATLRQREAYKADILNEEGFWGLAEWTPHRSPRTDNIGPPTPKK